ncbi:gliding motility-associated C-terminal domain-containing protein [Mesonia sp. K7]|uniref:T9SS type B sorting domain-containing protein n=1 Tax=Mesonia sp. K7 TaxID=2218606 RepID=UPI000DAA7F71|nr:gliding motility-associated C-terminal domain-containing protein [Mesonia sp. K7]PZD78621.1 hypothetical protein DNG35_03955 [Mesonia sp. K7]
MTKRLLYKSVIAKISLSCLFLVMSTMAVNAQTPPPAPTGQASQYFCSATSWLNAGFTEPDDTFDELYIYGENLTFYADQALTTVLPVSTPLQDGTTYYVTQTVAGVESAPLVVDVTDRECGCIKNHKFESYDGTPDSSGNYDAFDESYQQGHKTCGGSTAAATSIPVGAPDSATNATLVSFGTDNNTPLARTTPDNPYSEYGFRLNNGAGQGSANGKVNHMTKEFIAGEVFVFNFAAVFQNPLNHEYDEQPYFYVAIYDENGDLYTSRCIVSQPSDCIFFGSAGDVLYSEWSCMKLNTLPLIGEKATVQFTMGDCTLGGHWGYMYIDDLFVGDNIDSPCDSPSFGYIAMESVNSSPTTLDCVVDVAGTAQSCGDTINASVPFPIEVCGTIKMPVSNTTPPNIDDLTLAILQNGVQVGTATNPTVNGDQFCFTVDASDVNVSPYGQFELSSYVAYDLDCGEAYTIEITDTANVDICPTAVCAAPLEVCSSSGNGIGTFDLTQADAEFRGTDWGPADVDITYYETDVDAIDGNAANAIASPTAYQNITPYNQVVYARLDWHPQGSPTQCFYVMQLELTVYEDPIVNMPAQTVACGPGAFSVPIVATPANITDLTNVTYTWYRNGNLMAFSGSYYTATQGGTYTVEIAEANCSTTVTTDVVYAEYTVDLGAPLIDLCGTGDSVTLTADITDVASSPAMDMNDVTYLWNTNETTPSITVTQSGTYTVTTDYLGCVQTDMVNVQISERPVVDLGTNQTICNTPNDPTDDAVITANISNYQASEVEFVWYLDGGIIAGETGPTITVNTPGTYVVEVNEIGAPDCIGEDTVEVSFYANEGCVLPQGISPDTTIGLNDCLDLTFLNDRSGIQNIKFFNRHGRLINEFDNYTDDFCGADQNGNALPTGTYFYVMVLANEDAVHGKVKKGYVYINREAN